MFSFGVVEEEKGACPFVISAKVCAGRTVFDPHLEHILPEAGQMPAFADSHSSSVSDLSHFLGLDHFGGKHQTTAVFWLVHIGIEALAWLSSITVAKGGVPSRFSALAGAQRHKEMAWGAGCQMFTRWAELMNCARCTCGITSFSSQRHFGLKLDDATSVHTISNLGGNVMKEVAVSKT